MYKILIIDDEPDILSTLKDFFELEGYLVFTANSGREGIIKASCEPDIILLDINMPDENGFDVCEKIRDYLSCPILFLTARIEESDKIQGFRVGADDYVVKPFSLEELGARVMAHIRRERRRTDMNKVIFHEALVIDYSDHMIYFKNEPIHLAPKEFDIIEFLSKHPGQVFDKERIYETIWGYDGNGDSSVIAEHIRRIRMKFENLEVGAYIETVWGVGYRWKK